MNRPGSDAVFVPCDLKLAGTSTFLDQDRVVLEAPVTSEESYEENAPLQAAVTLASPGVVLLECAAITRGSSSSVDARYTQIDAVPLNALNRPGGTGPFSLQLPRPVAIAAAVIC